MRGIVSLERNSLFKVISNSEHTKDWIKYIYVNTFISIFFIILGLCLLPLSNSHLYGIMIGLFANWFSIILFIITNYFLLKIFSSPKGRIWLTYFTFVLYRTIFFLVIFFVPLLITNDVLNNNGMGVKLLLEPINIILVVLSYQTLTYTFILGSFLK